MSSRLAPRPDTSTPKYHSPTLECIYSADNSHRAVLTRDDGGLIRVSCEKWDLSEWEDCGYAFWAPIGRGATVTNTVDNGRRLAREKLIELGVAL
jgi:hypothetical protein